MRVLAIRTDKPEAELYIYEGHKKLAEIKWQAHRQLAETISRKTDEILDLLSISYKELDGIVCFKGPGSFTGLRIGISAANALAYAQNIPIIAKGGENWLKDGIAGLQAGNDEKIAVPEYGSPARTTPPKK